MNYTEKETRDWKIGMKKRGIRAPKRRPEQLPGMILVVDAKTGEYKEVKPVFKKVKIKKRRSKKQTK